MKGLNLLENVLDFVYNCEKRTGLKVVFNGLRMIEIPRSKEKPGSLSSA